MSYQILNLILLSFTVIINALFATGWITKSVKQISDEHESSVTPHPITFVIWLIIYIGQFMFFIFSNRIDEVGLLSIILNVLNMSWIVAWCFERLLLSSIIIMSMAGVLFQIYLTLDTTYFIGFWYYSIPFSLYFSWLIIATIANICSTIFFTPVSTSDIELYKKSQTKLGFILILLSTIPSIFLLLYKNDFFFASVLIWFYLGLALKQYKDGKLLIALLIAFAVIIGIVIYRIIIIT